MKKGYDHFTCAQSSRVISDATYLPAWGIFTKTWSHPVSSAKFISDEVALNQDIPYCIMILLKGEAPGLFLRLRSGLLWRSTRETTWRFHDK